MRRLLAVVFGVTCVAATGGVAQAAGGPAVVIKGGNQCSLPGADANGNRVFGGYGVRTIKLQNGNKVMITCRGTGITNESGTGQVYEGFGCSTVAPDGNHYTTTDSRATVSASGVATMTCTFRSASS